MGPNGQIELPTAPGLYCWWIQPQETSKGENWHRAAKSGLSVAWNENRRHLSVAVSDRGVLTIMSSLFSKVPYEYRVLIPLSGH